MKIWLDDIRQPPDDSWTVCRDVASFLAAIQYPPEIEKVSFDHDLGIFVNGKEVTGSSLARILVERFLEYGCKIPICRIHSANPEGRKNIESVINSAKKVQEEGDLIK